MPAYTTTLVMTSTSYRIRGFSSSENILRSCTSSSLPLSLCDGVRGRFSLTLTCKETPDRFCGVCRAGRRGDGLRWPSAVSLKAFPEGRDASDVRPFAVFQVGRREAAADERLSLRFCSLLAMYSLTSASDCGPIETVRLRVLESIAGISEAGGSTLSSLRSCGTLL